MGRTEPLAVAEIYADAGPIAGHCYCFDWCWNVTGTTQPTADAATGVSSPNGQSGAGTRTAPDTAEKRR